MKIKYSALVSDARGKLNGSVASKNRYGNYLRNKITPTNPQTSSQMRYRSLFGAISKIWGSLSQADRNAWDTFADEHPYIDIFGDTKILQGSAMHQKSNMNLAKIPAPLINVPGEPLSLPAFDTVSGTVTASPTGEITDIEVVLTYFGATASNMHIVVYATPPITAGRSFVKNDYRLIHVESPAAGASTTTMDITNEYIAKFGDSIEPTHKLFVRIAIVDGNNGLQSPPWEVQIN